MNYQARRPIGLGDRLLAPGDLVTEEELGEEAQRLLHIGAIEAEPKPAKARKQDEL